MGTYTQKEQANVERGDGVIGSEGCSPLWICVLENRGFKIEVSERLRYRIQQI